MTVGSLLAKALSVLLSVVVTLGLLEVGIRIMSPGSLHNQNIRVYDADVGYRFEKNINTVIDTGNGPHRIRTNSLGYIGTDVSQEKPDSTYRIVNIGDSYAEGVQEVDWDKNFVSLLPKKFSDQQVQNVESVNLGFSGRGTQEEYWAYKYVGKTLTPDLVILWVTIANDIANNYVPERQVALEKNSQGTAKQLLKKSALATFIFERIKGNAYALSVLRKAGLTNAVITEDFAHVPSTENKINYGTFTEIVPAQTQAYETTRQLLRAFRDETQADGVRFVVVVIPHFTDEEKFKELFADKYGEVLSQYDFTKAERELKKILTDLGVEHLFLRESLRTYELSGASCGPLWGDHFTACGHDIAASLVATYLAPSLTRSAQP